MQRSGSARLAVVISTVLVGLAVAALLTVRPLSLGVVPAEALTIRGPRTVDVRIPVRDGPARDQPQTLDARLYLPAGRGPAVMLAHGFGGTKESVDAEGRSLAARGYVALAWTARGFGDSTGQIALDSPDYEVADASQLVDWLAARPEVVLDGPGDPRVGVTGASYGGALALLLAGYDRRVDATVPVITWNDLGQSLFPNAATVAPPGGATPAIGAGSPNGVFKRGWAGVFFGTGSVGSAAGRDGGDAAAAGSGPDVCGRFTPEVCAGYVEAAQTGRVPPGLAALLARSSPASIAGRITAPTLLVQGEQDTLFGLDQADATARGIAAGGGRVAVAWFAGGHDGGSPDANTRARMDAWLDHYLRGAADPGTEFTFTLPSGVRARSAPTQRTVTAPAYPGLPASGTDPPPRSVLALRGETQQVLAPAGGNPSSLSSLPGLGGLAGAGGGDDGSSSSGGGGGGGSGGGGISSLAGRLATDLPGQAATFRTDPVSARTVVSGSPQVRLSVAAVPGQPTTGEAVLFGKVYDVAGGAPGGARTLLGNAVAPTRIPLAADGTATTVTVTLPGVVATVAEGHRLEVAVTTTDQAFSPSVAPAVYRIGLADPVIAVPGVPGEVRGGTSVPLAPLVAALVLLVGVGIAVLVGRVVAARRRRRDTEPGGDLAVDPELREVPLVVRGVAKAFPSGVRAVQDVSFRVERGQVLGLLGPNGAGKTTTLRMLMGLVRPSAGELRVFGVRVVPGAPVLGRIGSFVEGAGFLPHLSGRANLELYWAATGHPLAEARLDEALAIAGLGTAIDRTVRTYSHGMRQRLAIAQAMLGLPDLLVLDEPTNGLDPPQMHAMRDVLRSYALGGEHGRTVLVSSHQLAEVEQTCSHVVVMNRGRVVASGEVAELVAGGRIAVTVSGTPGARDRALESLAGTDVGVEPDPDDEDVLVVDLHDTDRGAVVRAIVEAGVDVVGVGPRRRLEDAFLALIGEEEPA